jgi:hypothetical protein
MGFSYIPMSEQQAMDERYNLLKEGEYDAVITASEDRVSINSGNSMMDMMISVFDDEGREHAVRDFLVFTPKMMWKVIHFADSAGLSQLYSKGQLCSELAVGNRVRVKITIEKGGVIPDDKLNGKPVGSVYPDKNKIEDYVKNVLQKPLPAKSGANLLDQLDEDVPF